MKTLTYQDQYIETLIKLIEANLDDTWLETFRSLRTGGYLPGGGAGSLNDWGPFYSDRIQGVWYGNLYDILRFLYDGNIDANCINAYKPIKHRNNMQIIRCLHCGGSYQHPSPFEAHFALDFYSRCLPQFVDNGKLTEILTPSESFENKNVIEYRNWLINRYEIKNIKIYNFVSAKYVCPHCENTDFETAHDLYKISHSDLGEKRFQFIKQNAIWEDFTES